MAGDVTTSDLSDSDFEYLFFLTVTESDCDEGVESLLSLIPDVLGSLEEKPFGFLLFKAPDPGNVIVTISETAKVQQQNFQLQATENLQLPLGGTNTFYP